MQALSKKDLQRFEAELHFFIYICDPMLISHKCISDPMAVKQAACCADVREGAVPVEKAGDKVFGCGH